MKNKKNELKEKCTKFTEIAHKHISCKNRDTKINSEVNRKDTRQ